MTPRSIISSGVFLGVAETAVVDHAVTGDVVTQGRGEALLQVEMILLISLVAKVPGFRDFLPDHPCATLQVQEKHVELHPVVSHFHVDALELGEGLAEQLKRCLQ